MPAPRGAVAGDPVAALLTDPAARLPACAPGRPRRFRPSRSRAPPWPSTTPRPAPWSTTTPDGPARLYVCGITPYDATHIGHAATYVAFDLLNRAWRNAGHEVTYVQNVTDVDDPLLERAAKVNVDWVELAERETELFRQDMAALRVLPPDALHRRRRVDPAGRST